MIVAGFVVLAVVGTLGRVMISERFNSARWPLGTLAVNMAGSFALGLLAGSDNAAMTVLGVAGLGSLTTFSTFSLELTTLGAARGWAYGVVTVGLGLAAATAGVVLSG